MSSYLNILKSLLTFIFLFFLYFLNPISAQTVEWVDNEDGTWTKYVLDIKGEDGPGWYPTDWGYYNEDNWDYGEDWAEIQQNLNWVDDFLTEQTTTVSCSKLVSATKKPLPTNTARTKIGIGEEVLVGILYNCSNFTNWKISGPGVLSNQTQNFCNFQAQWTPGKIKITAELNGGPPGCEFVCPRTLELEFEVVAPNDMYFDNSSITPPCPGNPHLQFWPSAGYFADNYLLPDDVNFYNVLIREKEAPINVSGIYFLLGQPFNPHPANAYGRCTSIVVPGKGTKVLDEDHIYMEFYCRQHRDPFLPGTIWYNIDTEYRDLKNNMDIKFTTVLQAGENIGFSTNPKFTTSKRNSSVSTLLLDPDKCTTGPNTCW